MNDFAKPTVMLPAGEPSISTWRDKATYRERLIVNFLSPLEEANRKFGKAPAELQRTVIEHLHWYFTTDLRERAPTVVVNEPMAVEFHALVGRIMHYIDIETIAILDSPEIGNEVKHALLSYKKPHSHSPVLLDAFDHDQGLLRLTYYLHGAKPREVFLLDGESVVPAYEKYRGCWFFRRMLMRQRIVWLSANQYKSITVLLDDKPVETSLQQQKLLASDIFVPGCGECLLSQAVVTYPPGKGPRPVLPFNLSGLKARVIRWLAQNTFICRKYGKAWVFMDRWCDADDNAEHLYRWMWENHPEVNIWFLLDPSSHDWARLTKEGFRLVPPGLQRKLLLLNSDHIISSHAELMSGGFDSRLYGDLMRWRYTFLQHGVIKDDLSHWLSNQPFDIFVTTSPAEFDSIVDDDTPYTYTAREIHRTGLQRHDRLLRYAAELSSDEINVILIMPTWRAGLVDGRATSESEAGRMAVFAKSEYALRWRAFLASEELRVLSSQYEKKIVFFPHPNSIPYLAAFAPPAHIQVATLVNTDIQRLFAKSLAFITDYTSVAFEMALMRRPTFYYQFDRQAFYEGGHNWRPGYFDCDRDGFGPVAFEQDELIRKIRLFLERGSKLDPKYYARMDQAIPDRDGQSCRRVYDSIIAIRKPFVASSSTHRLS